MVPEGASILAIDQGSTATKAGLVSSDGAILRLTEVPVASQRSGAQVEHDPEAIWRSIVQAVAELEIGSSNSGLDPPVPPIALALACQRSTCLLWERESGAPLSPALSWQDTRTAKQVDRLASLPGTQDLVAERTGLRLSPHYAAAKLALLLDQTPGARERAARGEVVAGTLDAFLVQRLTGQARTEPGCAGRTLLYNLEAGGWDEELCSLFSVPRAALPELALSGDDWGGCGEELGLEGLPLKALLGDQQAALLAHGGWQRGTVLVHFGTGAFALAGTGAELRRHPGLLSAVLAATADRRSYQLEAPVNSAGSAIDWAAQLAGEALDSWSETPLDYRELPLLVPAFSGLAAPWWRPQARAELAGLTLEHDGAALLGAAILGVAQRVVDGLETLSAAGGEAEIVLVSGKLTRLAGLVQAVADLGRIPVGVLAAEESGLVGAAMLARAVARRETVSDPTPRLARRVEPRLRDDEAKHLRRSWRRVVLSAMASGEEEMEGD